MRLTCPNCGVQYEVPDDVIPAEGRDVQCSNCGKTWFQDGAAAAMAAAPLDDAEMQPAEPPAAFDAPLGEDAPQEDFATPPEDMHDAPVAETAAPADAKATAMPDPADLMEEAPVEEDFAPVADPEPEPEPEPAPAPEPEPAPEVRQARAPKAPAPLPELPPEEEEDEAEFDAAPGPDPEMRPERPKRALDPSITDILRAEAQRETALRAAETTALETQPELGLETATREDTEERARQTRARMARLRGEDPAAEPVQQEEEFAGSRRGLLPDIDEINSTLKAGDEAPISADPDPYDAPPRRNGFLRGFALSVLVAVAAALLYQNAGALAEQMPGAAPVLESYVDWVNETRVWLHTKVEQLAQQPVGTE